MQLNVERPSHEQARTYIKENCTFDRKSRKKNIFVVNTPLKVFKKARMASIKNSYGTYHEAIISLLVPSGALIYVGGGWGFPWEYNRYDSLRKMRASEAYVHSITNIDAGYGSTFEQAVEVKEAISKWDSSFKYIVGTTVKPKRPFSKLNDACESGIHFFLNPHDAVNY